jgi:aldehyde dehydrogenase
MAAWKLAPALAAGNCSVLKPASPTPWSILKLAEVIEDIVPPGVINIVTGPGAEIGKALAANPRIAKIGFTGETVTGRLIMQYAAQNLIPSTVELGGKSPNIFFADVMAHDDEFLDKAVEGLVLYAFNKGEVCTAPSRALVHRDIYDEFMARALARIETMTQGNPLDTDTQLGAQVSAQQLEKIVSYVEIGRREGAEVLIGGERGQVGGDFTDGYYFQPTVLKGDNKMRVFQEEIFGPVLAVTTFADDADALEIANDTLYGLGAGVWTRDGTRAYRMGRGIKAGRVWTNCYHQYPAGAAFGGYKISGIGRENHRMMLDHYSQTKNLLVSYSSKPLGLF